MILIDTATTVKPVSLTYDLYVKTGINHSYAIHRM